MDNMNNTQKITTNNTIVFTRGFPASGKSTWAEKFAADNNNWVNINRDDIRAQFGIGGIGTRDEENTVTTVHHAMVDAAVATKKNIIISDMNIRVKDVKAIVSRVIDHGYTVEFKDFIVDIDELIRRNNDRAARGDRFVDDDVIRDMYAKFPYKKWVSADSVVEDVRKKNSADNYPVIVQDDTLPRAVVFDIDGTLANAKDENGEAIRCMFDGDVSVDTPNQNIIDIARMYHDNGFTVIVFSGRKDIYKDDTIAWLNRYGVPFDEIHMRGSKDMRNDGIVKYEMVKNFIEGKFFVHTVFDDRDRVVGMWRTAFANPTICCQVNYGDF